jgi:hypothetical protein
VTPINNPVVVGGGDILPNYWNPQRLDPDVIIPTAALPAAVAFGAGAWGAWAQLIAATPAAYVLVTAHLSKVVASSGNYWLEVGVGPAGREVPIAAIGDNCFISGAGAAPIVIRTYRLEPYLIPAGSRVVARGWHEVGNLSSRLALSLIPASPAATWYSPWPNTYIDGSRATKLWRTPAVNGWANIAGGGGAWSQVLAAAANDLLFNACEFNPMNAGGGGGNILELAVGPAGSEQLLSRVPIGCSVLIAFCSGYSEVGRKGLVLAGERVSARLALVPAGPWGMGFYFEDI